MKLSPIEFKKRVGYWSFICVVGDFSKINYGNFKDCKRCEL